MFEGKDPHVGIEDGLISAITCLKIDEARAQSKVLDLADEWSRIDAIFSKIWVTKYLILLEYSTKYKLKKKQNPLGLFDTG